MHLLHYRPTICGRLILHLYCAFIAPYTVLKRQSSMSFRVNMLQFVCTLSKSLKRCVYIEFSQVRNFHVLEHLILAVFEI